MRHLKESSADGATEVAIGVGERVAVRNWNVVTTLTGTAVAEPQLKYSSVEK